MKNQAALEAKEPVDDKVVMKTRIDAALADPDISRAVKEDFVFTFEQIGLNRAEADRLSDVVCQRLVEQKPLDQIEREINALFAATQVPSDNGQTRNILNVLHDKLSGRAALIFSQISPHLGDVQGKALDFGCGDGQVTQLVHDKLELDVEGCDVRDYRASNVKVPIRIFDGHHLSNTSDGQFDTAVVTNVLHHADDNEAALKELSRVTGRKLVVIETVPIAKGKTEWERTFINDYLYNRLFHTGDVPVPGTYELQEDWPQRFEKHGWKLTHQQELGYDQPTIRDWHVLYTFERTNQEDATVNGLAAAAQERINDTVGQ